MNWKLFSAVTAVVFTLFAVSANAQTTGTTPPFNGTCQTSDLVSYLIVANAYKQQKLEPALAAATKPEAIELAFAPIVGLQEAELNVLAGCGFKSPLPVEEFPPSAYAPQTPKYIASYIIGTVDRENSAPLLSAFFGAPANGFNAKANLNGVAGFIQSSHDEAETFLQNEAQLVTMTQDSH